MEWSPEQEAALRAVADWVDNRETGQVFRLFGFAGTGKTTLAKHLAETVDGDVLFGAFTGKAASVLRKKGCAGATTIHSMIYNVKDKSAVRLKQLEAELFRLRLEGLERSRAAVEAEHELEAEWHRLRQPAFSLAERSPVEEARLVIIDECSMVDGRMGEDLLSFGTPVLVLGDPAQLPPVHGGGFFTNSKPDIMLTGIHRQARDNPIIDLATRVREGKGLDYGTYGESRVVRRSEITSADVLAADQILVGRNITRTSYNARVRELKGFSHGSHEPIPGDKLVCLRNNHDLGLLNGTIWHAGDIAEIGEERVIMNVIPEDEGDELIGVECHMAPFRGEEKKMLWFERKDAEEFTFGYALTVHKSQGSAWDHVYLFDESGVFRQDSAKWLYTGITRAAEKIVIAR